MAVRIGRKSYSGKQANVGIRGEITKYANMATYAMKDKMDGFTYAKVWFMPGQVNNSGEKFENVAFASYQGMPDFEHPMAKFNVIRDPNLGWKLTSRFYDHYANVMEEWKQALEASNGNHKRARETVAAAAITNSTDIDATKNLNILAKVLGLQTRSYFLQEVVTRVPAPNLVFSADTYTEGSVAGKVSELMEPKLQAHTEARATKVLYKNVGHIAISEEARLMGLHNTMALRQDWTMRDLQRLINAQVATELETATSNAGNDWGAIDATYFRSTKKPHDDLQPDVTTIRGNGFNVDFLALHDRPAQDIASNDFIKGPGSQTSGLILNNVDHFQIMGLPPVVVDQALTATVAIIGSRDAVWLGVGPTTISAYNNDVVGYEGWLAKQWFLPYLANAGAIRKRTAVSA